METKIFNWGIIGPGRIAKKFAECLKVVNDATLYAVASKNKERADTFLQENNAKKAYYSYEDLVADENIDAIYIATPHRFHFEHASLALNTGKHVLCEKPMTVNADETKQLIALAKSKNLFFMEALWTRYLPIYKHVKTWIKDGLIGEIKLLNSTFGFSFPRNEDDRVLNHQLAGGTLLDMGIYPIAVSQFFIEDNPIEISANSMIGHTNVDEVTSVTLKYKNNIMSQFTTNILAKTNNDFIIYGTKGQITIHPNFWGSTKATLLTNDKEITEERPFRATGFEYQIEEVMSCIRAGKLESNEMTLENTLANMELMDKIRKQIGLKYNFE